MLKLLVIKFVLLTILGTSSGETAYDVANRYTECDGEETGIMRTAPTAAPYYFQCGGLLGLKPKYCVYRCTAKKLGFINSQDRMNKKVMKEFAQELNNFKKKREMYRRAVKCGESQTFSERNDCETTEEMWNCLMNAYDEVCNGKSSKVNDDEWTGGGILEAFAKKGGDNDKSKENKKTSKKDDWDD